MCSFVYALGDLVPFELRLSANTIIRELRGSKIVVYTSNLEAAHRLLDGHLHLLEIKEDYGQDKVKECLETYRQPVITLPPNVGIAKNAGGILRDYLQRHRFDWSVGPVKFHAFGLKRLIVKYSRWVVRLLWFFRLLLWILGYCGLGLGFAIGSIFTLAMTALFLWLSYEPKGPETKFFVEFEAIEGQPLESYEAIFNRQILLDQIATTTPDGVRGAMPKGLASLFYGVELGFEFHTFDPILKEPIPNGTVPLMLALALNPSNAELLELARALEPSDSIYGQTLQRLLGRSIKGWVPFQWNRQTHRFEGSVHENLLAMLTQSKGLGLRYRQCLEGIDPGSLEPEDQALLAMCYHQIGDFENHHRLVSLVRASGGCVPQLWARVAWYHPDLFNPCRRSKADTLASDDVIESVSTNYAAPHCLPQLEVAALAQPLGPDGQSLEIVSINLERRKDRLENLKRQLPSFHRLRATDWKAGDVPKSFEEVTGRAYKVGDSNVTIDKGVLACYLSHSRALKYLAEGETKGVETYDGGHVSPTEPPKGDYLMVTEDDIRIVNSPAYLAEKLRQVPDDWDIITFGSYPFIAYNNDLRTIPIAPNVWKWKGLYINAHCYLIRKDVAQYFLKYVTYPMHEQVDVIEATLTHHGFNIYNIDGYCYQSDFATDIQNLMTLEYQAVAYRQAEDEMRRYLEFARPSQPRLVTEYKIRKAMDTFHRIIKEGDIYRPKEVTLGFIEDGHFFRCRDILITAVFLGRRGDATTNHKIAREILKLIE